MRIDRGVGLHSGGGVEYTPLDILPPRPPIKDMGPVTPWIPYPQPKRTWDQEGTWDQRYPTPSLAVGNDT